MRLGSVVRLRAYRDSLSSLVCLRDAMRPLWRCICLSRDRYLKVHSFEAVFGAVAKGKYGLWAGRTAVMTSIIGLVTSWLGSEVLSDSVEVIAE